jgi:hypothetical protein
MKGSNDVKYGLDHLAETHENHTLIEYNLKYLTTTVHEKMGQLTEICFLEDVQKCLPASASALLAILRPGTVNPSKRFLARWETADLFAVPRKMRVS